MYEQLILNNWGTNLFIIFILVSILGHFANFLINRLPQHIQLFDLVKHYLNSFRYLNFFQYIPFLRYTTFCNSNNKALPFRYILVDFFTLIIVFLYISPFSVLFMNHQFFIFSYTMIIMFFTDIEHYYLSFSLNIGLFIMAIYIASENYRLWPCLSQTFLVIAGLLLLRFIANLLFRRNSMGLGDIILLGVIAANWGATIALGSLYIAVALCSIFSFILFLLKKISSFKQIPFGPYIIMGFLISYFFIDSLLIYLFN